MITLVLPLPPSVNAAYRNTRRGRAKTAAYIEWLGSAGCYLIQQKEWKKHKIVGAYALDIQVHPDIKGDIDNRIKLISDLLVSIEVINDDRRAWRVSVERSHAVENKDECLVKVNSIKTNRA